MLLSFIHKLIGRKEEDDINYDRKILMARTSTSIDELTKLSFDKNNFVRWHVVLNNNVPKEVLLRLLINDDDASVREVCVSGLYADERIPDLLALRRS